MQTSFESQASYSINRSSNSFSGTPFARQASTQFSQQSFSGSVGGNGLSASSSSYFSQQSSRGPGGFSPSVFSSKSASFDRQGFGGDSRCAHSESEGYAHYENRSVGS